MNVTLSVETAGQRADQFLAARLDLSLIHI